MNKIALDSRSLDKSYSSRLREVYNLEEGPRTLGELSQIWNKRILAAFQTEKGGQSLDRLTRGELVYGESRAATRHLVRLQDGRAVHVYCALDALIEGFFRDVEIESSCPHCNEIVSLKMASRQIVSTKPESTVLWLGISPRGEGPTTQVLCPFINFFTSKDHADQWRRANPEQVGVLLSLSGALGFVAAAFAAEALGIEQRLGKEALGSAGSS